MTFFFSLVCQCPDSNTEIHQEHLRKAEPQRKSHSYCGNKQIGEERRDNMWSNTITEDYWT